ncbi:MAG TPA: lipocalin family protein [Agitococcus sp.]|nr:lipocalin family protein [Agitococcus sp.]
MVRYFVCLIMLLSLPTWASFTPQTVPKVDLNRYMGKWYEIAKIPNSFQKTCVSETTVTYTLLANHHVAGVNACKKANGELYQLKIDGKVQDASNAKIVFKITSSWLRFIPMVRADYWIVDLAADYSYAAVATADGKYLWILARQAQLNDSVYEQILQRVAKQGFAIQKVQKNK